ncbi:MAG: hypothetical protein FGM58_08360 [Acidimicrobiia bacterium]|nr:hypothetical protein [Acidimicrobiia bacterium]
MLDLGVLTWTERYHDPYLDGHGAALVRRPGMSPATYSIEELRVAREQQGVVMGHLTMRTFLDAGVDRCWVLVREPRSRLVSRFEHARANPHERGLLGPEGSFGEFLRAPAFSGEIDNFEVRMLRPSMASPDVELESDPARFRRATRRELRVVRPRLAGAVWSTGTNGAGSRLLADVGVPPEVSSSGLPRENVSSVPGEERILTGDAMERLEELTWRSAVVFEELTRIGLLAPRSRAELDAEFQRTLEVHRIRVV